MDTINGTETIRFSNLSEYRTISVNFIIPGSVVVTGKTENVDYTVDYRNGLIYPISTGTIVTNTNYTITYKYKGYLYVTLESKLMADITPYNEYPQIGNLDDAINQAIDYLNGRVRFVGYTHLYLDPAITMYVLTDNVYQLDSLLDMNFDPVHTGSINTAISNSTGHIIFDEQSEYSVNLPYVVFRTSLTVRESVKVRYFGTHVKDINNAFNYMTDQVATLVLLKAKSLIYMRMAAAASKDTIKFAIGDKDFDKTQQAPAFMNQSKFLTQEFETVLSAYIGRIVTH